MIDAVPELVSALFLAWRRALTAVARGPKQAWRRVRSTTSRWSARWLPIRSYLADTASAWRDGYGELIDPAVAFGIRAFAAGMLVSIGITIGAGSRVAAAGLVVLTEMLWAAARLVIVLLVAPPDVPRRDILRAFGAGLAPYALGITPLLRLASLVLSGILTARGLTGAGVATRTMRTAIGWAFGSQAAIVVGGTIIRGAIALLSAL